LIQSTFGTPKDSYLTFWTFGHCLHIFFHLPESIINKHLDICWPYEKLIEIDLKQIHLIFKIDLWLSGVKRCLWDTISTITFVQLKQILHYIYSNKKRIIQYLFQWEKLLQYLFQWEINIAIFNPRREKHYNIYSQENFFTTFIARREKNYNIYSSKKKIL
jgi:hypothetical protein